MRMLGPFNVRFFFNFKFGIVQPYAIARYCASAERVSQTSAA